MPSIQLPLTQMFLSCQLHLANWPRDKSWDYMKKRGHRVVTWEDLTQPVPVKEDENLWIPSMLIWFDKIRGEFSMGATAWVIQYPEQLKGNRMRLCSLTDYYSQDLIITLNFLGFPVRLPELPISRK